MQDIVIFICGLIPTVIAPLCLVALAFYAKKDLKP